VIFSLYKNKNNDNLVFTFFTLYLVDEEKIEERGKSEERNKMTG